MAGKDPLKDLMKFIESNSSDVDNEEELNDLISSYLKAQNSKVQTRMTEKDARTSDDYMELAEDAKDLESALKYARKALKLDPDNLEAELFVADYSATSVLDNLNKAKRAVDHGTDVMTRQGYMNKENEGEFWLLFETRPYMRILKHYVEALIECGMMKKAASECENILRLNTNDNMGARYTLMHLYALLEMEDQALELHKRYKEDSTLMLLPLSLLYYKQDDYSKASRYLTRLVKANPDTRLFFRIIGTDEFTKIAKNMNSFGYRPNTIEEFVISLEENSFAFEGATAFFEWASEQLRKK